MPPRPAYGRAVAAIPPMESLLEAGHAPPECRTGQAPQPGAGFSGPAGRASSLPPSFASSRAPPAETSDSLTAESLLNGKRSAAGSGWRHRISRVTGGLAWVGGEG